MKKTYLSTAITLALGLLSNAAVVQAQQVCVGSAPAEIEAVADVSAPLIGDVDILTEVNEGDTVTFTTIGSVDTDKDGKPTYQWCVDFGQLNALGQSGTTSDAVANTTTITADALATDGSTDFSQIQFTAPFVAEQGATVELGLTLSDGLGHSDFKTFPISILSIDNTNADDPSPEISIDTPSDLANRKTSSLTFSLADVDADQADSTDKLVSALYYRIDEGDFKPIFIKLEGQHSEFTWRPDFSAEKVQLKLVSTDSNTQTEVMSGTFSVTPLLQDIFVSPVDENGDAIIGGTIEITINLEIVFITDDDNDGKYEIAGVPEGDHDIKVVKDDRTYETNIQVIALEEIEDGGEGDENAQLRAEITAAFDDKPIVDQITISPVDQQGEAIINGTIEVVINGEIVIITDEDGDGKYVVSNISEGEHEIKIEKDGFQYPPSTVNIDAETTADTPVTASVPPPFEEAEPGSETINRDDMVIVGAYACEQNQVRLVDLEDTSTFHSFNADLDSRGIYINQVDFNRDGLTDVATGGIAKGKDMLIYDTNKELIGKIISNGDDQGVLIAFGDVDADQDFEIMVTNQSADDTVNLFESDGKAIRRMTVLQGKQKINIATGDVNGDGVDELIVVVSEKNDGDNVLIFDENANLINSFKAQPNSDNGDDTYGLTVAVGDTDGDGKDNIIVAEAMQKESYGVAIYDGDGNLIKQFNAFAGQADDDSSSASQCPATAYDGKGLVLTTGDTNQNGKAEIIISRAGYRKIKIFNADGELLEWFNGAPEGFQITALGFGHKMGVKLPTTDLPEDETAPLENITVIGVPGEPRPEIKDREIRGTVRVAYTLVIKIKIKIGARFIAGFGTRFKERDSIPPGLNMNGICPMVKPKVKKKHKKWLKSIEVLNLNTPVIDNAPSVLEDIKVLAGDDAAARPGLENMGLRRSHGGIHIDQDLETGNLIILVGNQRIEVMPVDMTQAAADAPAGVSVDSNGTAYITTQQGQRIELQAAVQDLDGFADTLSTFGTLTELSISEDGQMIVRSAEEDTVYRVGRPHFFSQTLDASSDLSLGLHDADVLFEGVDNAVIFVFMGTDGVKRWQFILPTPADRAALLALAEENSQLEAVTLHYDNAPGSIPGTVSFMVSGQSYLGLFDYIVREGTIPASGGVEINPVDDKRFEIVYPNGDRQYVFLVQ